MPTFKELIRDKKVASHPLLQGYHNLGRARDAMNKHAQDLQEDLVDLLSQKPYQEEKPQDLNGLIREASMLVRDVFSQFDIPVTPKFFYETVRDIKHARNDEQRVVAGSIIFGGEFRSITGVRKRATISIPISAGELVPPSIMEVDGVLYVIGQSTLDEILDRNTAFFTPNLREGYQSPPLNRFEREMAVQLRNSMGVQPRKNPGSYYLNQRNVEARRRGAIDDPWTDPEAIAEYDKEQDARWSPVGQAYAWILENSELVDDLLDETGGNLDDVVDQLFDHYFDIEDVDTSVTEGDKDYQVHLDALKKYVNQKLARRKQAAGPAPRMFKQVVEAMEKAEKDKLDTFPRTWTYVLHNYILNFVSTASKDAWEPHLINEGFCLNPYGKATNRGRRRARKEAQGWDDDASWEFDDILNDPNSDPGKVQKLKEQIDPEVEQLVRKVTSDEWKWETAQDIIREHAPTDDFKSLGEDLQNEIGAPDQLAYMWTKAAEELYYISLGLDEDRKLGRRRARKEASFADELDWKAHSGRWPIGQDFYEAPFNYVLEGLEIFRENADTGEVEAIAFDSDSEAKQVFDELDRAATERYYEGSGLDWENKQLSGIHSIEMQNLYSDAGYGADEEVKANHPEADFGDYNLRSSVDLFPEEVYQVALQKVDEFASEYPKLTEDEVFEVKERLWDKLRNDIISKKSRKWVRAQNVKGDFEKEIEMEVEEPVKDLGVDQLFEDSESPEKEPKFYAETKTPIEMGDGVRLRKGPGGGKGFQGTIVEVDEAGDYLIIKSKGMEYRVTVDDIEPVPSTFKKMYM